MRIIASLLLLAAVAPLQAQQADSVPTASAYLDANARTLVKLARERRQIADLSVDSYKALSKERVSVGLRGLRRDRLLYRREVAGRIEWSRNGPRKIEILGAREAVPVAIHGVQLPSDLGSFMPHLAFDPANNQMLLGWGDNDFVRHPLAEGSERYYQFRTGVATSIQLPNGKIIHLVELQIIPRTSDSHDVSGSFWLDTDTHAVVQAAFRLARDINVLKDMDEDSTDDKDMPGFLKPLTFSIDYVTIDYGLYDLQWWMPRSILFQGAMRVGFIRTPMEYERTYSQYEIHGSQKPDTLSIAEVMRRDSLDEIHNDSCDKHTNVSVRIGAVHDHSGATKTDSVITTRCGRWQITMPNDTAALLASAELPPNVFAAGEELLSENELKELQNRVEKLGAAAGMLPEPVTDVSLLSLSQMRYNRVEGLSLGARGSVDYGRYRGTASARIGVADLQPNFELAVERPGIDRDARWAIYRRLNPFDPQARPFSMGASISSLFLGRDEAEYYRTLGTEITIEPVVSRARWYSLRLFAQRETAAEKKTDFSLRRVFNGDYDFRPNPAATVGNEAGAELTLRVNHGLNPDGLRIGAELYNHAAAGTNRFARSALTLRAGFPITKSVSAALEGATGLTSRGAPVQHLWYLGGPSTLRGYNAGVLSGDAFWRGRAEIGYGMPAVRLVGFSDVGWAGARSDWKSGAPLVGAGVGASFLDGLVRFDLARGLRGPKGWSATLYLDAAL